MAAQAVQTVTLASGRKMPIVGFGTGTAWYKGPAAEGQEPPLDQQLVDTLKAALKAGFTHVDAAEMYGTDREIGVALGEHMRETGTPREALWVTNKVFLALPEVEKVLRKSLSDMQLQYVDLYLVHAPFFKDGVTMEKVWREMERMVELGLAKEIGVSNFRVSDLEALLKICKIKPVVNQVEAHPYLQQDELDSFCKQHGIQLAAYSPLTPLTNQKAGPVDEVVARVAAAHDATPGQVLLRWAMQRGYVPITTTRDPARMSQFLSAGTGKPELSEAEVKEISEAGKKLKYRRYWVKEYEAKEN